MNKVDEYVKTTDITSSKTVTILTKFYHWLKKDRGAELREELIEGLIKAEGIYCRSGTTLSLEDACYIWQLRGSKVPATHVAEAFGVAPRAVKDIWYEITWSRTLREFENKYTKV